MQKRFREHRFAAGANRDYMEAIEFTGMDFDEFIDIALEAMREICGPDRAVEGGFLVFPYQSSLFISWIADSEESVFCFGQKGGAAALADYGSTVASAHRFIDLILSHL